MIVSVDGIDFVVNNDNISRGDLIMVNSILKVVEVVDGTARATLIGKQVYGVKESDLIGPQTIDES